MGLTLILPWFPIVLAVGVGARLLGRTRGMALGVLCAMFWIVLVQATTGVVMWQDPWTVLSVISGALAIAAMGRWSGMMPEMDVAAGASLNPTTSSTERHSPQDEATAHISWTLDQFDDWLEHHRGDSDPWPAFDEFVRMILYRSVKATHVRPYRLLSEGQALAPLRESDPLALDATEAVSAREGIVGHVVTSGRSYLAGNDSGADLVEKLAEDSTETIAWCFPVRQGTQRLGAVVVGHLDVAPEGVRLLLRAMEQLVSQFWSTLLESTLSRTAAQVDPVTGLCTRPTFLRMAEESLRHADQLGEPVAVAVVAIEGLRELNDAGRWELADELIVEVSRTLKRKVRTDDRLGRFDGSRFVLLLQRVDTALASLIVSQIMSRLAVVCGNEDRWQAGQHAGTKVIARCGVVGSGTQKTDLRALVSGALVQCRRARTENLEIASDVDSPGEPAGRACLQATNAANGVTA